MTAVMEDLNVVEFRGRMLMMTVLQLNTLDLELLRTHLDQQLTDSPDWLRDVPIVLSFPDDAEDISVVDLTLTMEALRDRDMNLVAVARHAAIDEQDLRMLGIGSVVLSAGGRAVPAPRDSDAKATAAEPARETLVIDQTVRSGQQIYSRGDLVVLAPVGTGAELMAEGHIHVYSNLRGRALAGVRGDTRARIFCQQLNAELVSIAGHYRVSEDLPERWQGEAVQLTLDGEAMLFSPLKSK